MIVINKTKSLRIIVLGLRFAHNGIT